MRTVCIHRRVKHQGVVRMAGRWFEEFAVGQVFDHEIRRTVTESDNILFCSATYKPAAVHIDAEYCNGTEMSLT
jgi:acyl dehydratase